MRKLILCIALAFILTANLWAVDYYSKDEVDLKLQLMEEKVNSHLNAMSREDKAIDSKMINQDKLIQNQDKQIESLKYIFGILLSVIAIIVGVSGSLIDKRNKERGEELEREIKEIQDEATRQLEQLRDIAKLEVHMARVEVKQIKMEAQDILANLKEKMEDKLDEIKELSDQQNKE